MTGIFYGVTTNPRLLHQAGISFTVDHLAKLANTAFELGANEIQMKVWGRETEPIFEDQPTPARLYLRGFGPGAGRECTLTSGRIGYR